MQSLYPLNLIPITSNDLSYSGGGGAIYSKEISLNPATINITNKGDFYFESGINQGVLDSSTAGKGVRVWNPVGGPNGDGAFDEYIRPAQTSSFLTAYCSNTYYVSCNYTFY